MKKLLMLMSFAGVLFCSCNGNKAETAATEAETDSLAMIDSAVTSLTNEIQSKLDEKDATGVNELLQQAGTYIQQLVANGNAEQAKAYAEKVKEYVSAHAEDLKTIGVSETASQLIEAAAAVPSDVTEEAKNAIDQTVQNAKDAGQEVVDAAKQKATEAANQAVEKAKSDAKESVDKAVDKTKKETTEKANKAIDDAKQKALKGLGL